VGESMATSIMVGHTMVRLGVVDSRFGVAHAWRRMRDV